MKLLLAKSPMRCADCGAEIGQGEYYSNGPTCYSCVLQPRPRAPKTETDTAAPLLFADESRELTEVARETLGATSLRFAGPDYVPKHDQVRLTKKLLLVFELMSDEKFRTINEIYDALDGQVAHTTISANLRHLKKEEFGSHGMNKRRRGDESNGVFEYQIIPNLQSVKAA